MTTKTRQASGATIIVADGEVHKVGPPGPVGERCALQGRWLQRRVDDGFVRVLEVGSLGYKMELLTPLVEPICADYAVTVMWDILERTCWSQSMPSPNWNTHHAYVWDRTQHVLLGDDFNRFTQLRNRVQFTRLRPCVIHGDPTIDNCMVRPATGRLTLTDPIPSSDNMPGTRAVDVGKMLQSIYGFERVKYDANIIDTDLAYSLLVDRIGYAELIAATYMCAVHYLRLIPYHVNQREEFKEVLLRVIDDGLRL